MIRAVVYSSRAEQQIVDLYRWIAEQSGSPDRASGYVEAILAYCDGLSGSPYRGVSRDDLRSGLRVIGFRRRVVIAFAVHEETVEILGIYYGGQDYEGRFSSDVD